MRLPEDAARAFDVRGAVLVGVVVVRRRFLLAAERRLRNRRLFHRRVPVQLISSRGATGCTKAKVARGDRSGAGFRDSFSRF